MASSNSNRLDRYTRLDKKVKQLTTSRDQTQGELTALLERLKQEFGCETVDEARQVLDDKVKKLDELDIRIGKKVDMFEEKYGDRLEEATKDH